MTSDQMVSVSSIGQLGHVGKGAQRFAKKKSQILKIRSLKNWYGMFLCPFVFTHSNVDSCFAPPCLPLLFSPVLVSLPLTHNSDPLPVPPRICFRLNADATTFYGGKTYNMGIMFLPRCDHEASRTWPQGGRSEFTHCKIGSCSIIQYFSRPKVSKSHCMISQESFCSVCEHFGHQILPVLWHFGPQIHPGLWHFGHHILPGLWHFGPHSPPVPWPFGPQIFPGHWHSGFCIHLLIICLPGHIP